MCEPCPTCRSALCTYDWIDVTTQHTIHIYPRIIQKFRRLICQHRSLHRIVLCRNAVQKKNLQEWFTIAGIVWGNSFDTTHTYILHDVCDMPQLADKIQCVVFCMYDIPCDLLKTSIGNLSLSMLPKSKVYVFTEQADSCLSCK
jgi:hypothetical protein